MRGPSTCWYRVVPRCSRRWPTTPQPSSSTGSGWSRGAIFEPLWKRWLTIYALRVEVQIAVERVIVYPDISCRGSREVFGAELPAEPPPSQSPPAKGTAPRINQTRAARQAARLPNLLIGWVDTDGLPMVIPAEVSGSNDRGIVLDVPALTVPPGARRAGLTAHWFSHGVVGQRQNIHTGWMQAAPGAST